MQAVRFVPRSSLLFAFVFALFSTGCGGPPTAVPLSKEEAKQTGELQKQARKELMEERKGGASRKKG
jgi:hypothetical protein